MIWSEIDAEILRGLKEPSTGGHWTPAERLRRANIGQRLVVRRTSCMTEVNTDVVTVIGQTEYSKPTKTLSLIRAYYNTSGNRLWPIDISDLDIASHEGRASKPWTDDQGTPTNFYEKELVIGLYPKPDAAGVTIGQEIIVRPTALADPGDTPFNGVANMEEYHDLIADYVLWKCLLEDGDDRFKEYKGQFGEGLRSIMVDLKKRPDSLDTFQLIRSAKGKLRGPLPIHEG